MESEEGLRTTITIAPTNSGTIVAENSTKPSTSHPLQYPDGMKSTNLSLFLFLLREAEESYFPS